jgi:predicted Zn-dependent protease
MPGCDASVSVLLPWWIGQILMAKAGYDPHEALPFWERMSSGKQGKGAPEFLSTHPSGDTRIKQLR